MGGKNYLKLFKDSKKYARYLRNTEKKLGVKAAKESLNQKLRRLNKKLDDIPFEAKGGIIKIGSLYDSTDPELQNDQTQKKFQEYIQTYLHEASSGPGLLLLTDTIKNSAGGLKKLENDQLEEDKNDSHQTEYTFKPHSYVSSSDIIMAKDEAIEQITKQAHKLNKRDMTKRENEALLRQKKKVKWNKVESWASESLKLNYSRKEDIAWLVRTNPSAVGQILIKYPEFLNIVCQAINQIEVQNNKKEKVDQAFLWGGLIVGGGLAITGIGFGAGAALVAGTTASLSLKAAAAATLIAGTAVGALEAGHFSAKTYRHYQDFLDFERAFIAGNSDGQSILKAQKALTDFKSARIEAALSIGFSLANLGVLKAANKLGYVSLSAGRKGLQTLSPKQLEVLSSIYKAIARPKVASKLREVLKLMGRKGGEKLDQFLTLLSQSSESMRIKLLEALADTKMTPNKIKEIIEEALEVVSKQGCKNGCSSFEKVINEYLDEKRKFKTGPKEAPKDRRSKPRNNSVDRRLFDPEQRAELREIESGLGTRKSKLLLRYYVGKNYQLTPRDKIYFAGLADMVEKEVKDANKLLTPMEIRKETRKILDEIIESCKK